MKKLLSIVLLITLISCGEKDIIDSKPSYPDKIILESPDYSPDSVVINWSALRNPAFAYYQIIRTTGVYDQSPIVTTITDYKTTKYVDRSFPYSPTLTYQIVAILNSGASISSNSETVTQETLQLTMNPLILRNDSIYISWNKINHKSLTNYSIVRFENNNENPTGSVPALANATAVDVNYPYIAKVGYQIVANFTSGVQIRSNKEFVDVPPPQIVLDPLTIYNDSVKLTWKGLRYSSIYGYNVVRKISPTDAGTVLAYLDGRLNSYTDKSVPYTAYVSYEIKATVNSLNSIIVSNPQVYERANISTIYGSPYDLKYDEATKKLYIIERTGKITIYNTSAKQVEKSISTGATLGFCDIGTHNGTKELYVPRTDGWIFIYNAATLELTDQVSVGMEASSVVYNDNKIFVSTAAWTNNPLRVFDRTTKNLITKTGEWDRTRVKKIPGSNTELIEISRNISPTDLDYWNFDTNGALVTHTNDPYHGTYALDPNIFEIFPSGQYLITAANGTIYKKNLEFTSALPAGNLSFRTFAFNTSRQHIYGGSTAKTIETFSLNTFLPVKSTPVKIYPFKIFVDGNDLLVLGTSEPNNFNEWSLPSYLVMEKIAL